jgi:alcohol dehydrogenase
MQAAAIAKKLLKDFKGDNYAFGINNLNTTGEYAAQYGKSVLLIANSGSWLKPVIQQVITALQKSGLCMAGDGIIPGAGVNSPKEDVYRIKGCILEYKPDCLLAIGGGSTIDAVKAANVLATLGHYHPGIDAYFGTGLVSQTLKTTNQQLVPFIAVQTVAGSGAHLTKYSNITDTSTGQKKLIMDDAITPNKAVFDYSLTSSTPLNVVIDGALDGLAHCLEVFYGVTEKKFSLVSEIALTGIELIITNIRKAIANPQDLNPRIALGLGTDLGGYAIMVGGTSGPHLNSFSMINLTSHGRACGIAEPYYTVFFAPAIQRQLNLIGAIFQRAGFITENIDTLSGRALGVAVANGMIAFYRSINAPSKFLDLPGFNDGYIERALRAAKDPQLEMKLKNMPVPLDIYQIDEYMGSVLKAAREGDLNLVKCLGNSGVPGKDTI